MSNSVSIVIPSTRPDTVRRAVESVLEQQMDIEVIVVYDGSQSDNSYAEIVETVGPDAQVLATGSRSNANVARNLGIAAASKAYIALLDDDDVWEPRKLEAQFAAVPIDGDLSWLSTTQVAAVGTGGSSIWPQLAPPDHGPLDSYLLGRHSLRATPTFLQTSTWLAPAEVLKSRPFDESLSLHQDLDWLIRYFADGSLRLIHVDAPLVRYDTGSSGSVSRSARWRASLGWIKNPVLPVSRRVRGDFILCGIAPKLLPLAEYRAAAELALLGIFGYGAGLQAIASAGNQALRFLASRSWTAIRKGRRPS